MNVYREMQCVMWGIQPIKPITPPPQGQIRIQMRAKSIVTAFVRDVSGIKKFTVVTHGKTWKLGPQLAENRRCGSLWIPVAKQTPNDDRTVLIANNDWSESVRMGSIHESMWFSIDYGCLDGLGADENGKVLDVDWNPPTHWMHLPEPPQIEAAKPSNPFAVASMPGCITAGVEDRCYRVKKFGAEECRAALALPDLEKTVRVACERRLRKLEKEAKQ